MYIYIYIERERERGREREKTKNKKNGLVASNKMISTCCRSEVNFSEVMKLQNLNSVVRRLQ